MPNKTYEENPLSKLYAQAKKAVAGAATAAKKGLSSLFANKKKKKKKKKDPNYSKRVDIYAQGQKRKQMMEEAGK